MGGMARFSSAMMAGGAMTFVKGLPLDGGDSLISRQRPENASFSGLASLLAFVRRVGQPK